MKRQKAQLKINTRNVSYYNLFLTKVLRSFSLRWIPINRRQGVPQKEPQSHIVYKSRLRSQMMIPRFLLLCTDEDKHVGRDISIPSSI